MGWHAVWLTPLEEELLEAARQSMVRQLEAIYARHRGRPPGGD